jgi:maltose O-acetyltransferase
MKYRKRFITMGFWYAFEKDFHLAIEDHGIVQLGKKVYFSKRTDIVAVGGNIKIGNGVFFNKDCMIVSMNAITIGNYCQIGEMTAIYDHDHNLHDFNKPISKQGFSTKPVSIGNNVWVGGKVFIKAGVTIGDNVIIGANSVVTKDVPSGMIAYGNPAKYRPPVPIKNQSHAGCARQGNSGKI